MALAFGAACFAGWIVALAVSLPSRHVAGHWNLTWVGFDTMQFGSMIIAAWTFARRPRAAPTAFLVTAVLLVCDAWFDVTTASGGADTTVSLLFALLLELPLAAAFAWGSGRQARRLAARSARAVAGVQRPVSSDR